MKDLDYYTNLASERLSIAVESYKPGPWIVAPPPQSATINALDAAVARYVNTVSRTSSPYGSMPSPVIDLGINPSVLDDPGYEWRNGGPRQLGGPAEQRLLDTEELVTQLLYGPASMGVGSTVANTGAGVGNALSMAGAFGDIQANAEKSLLDKLGLGDVPLLQRKMGLEKTIAKKTAEVGKDLYDFFAPVDEQIMQDISEMSPGDKALAYTGKSLSEGIKNMAIGRGGLSGDIFASVTDETTFMQAKEKGYSDVAALGAQASAYGVNFGVNRFFNSVPLPSNIGNSIDSLITLTDIPVNLGVQPYISGGVVENTQYALNYLFTGQP